MPQWAAILKRCCIALRTFFGPVPQGGHLLQRHVGQAAALCGRGLLHRAEAANEFFTGAVDSCFRVHAAEATHLYGGEQYVAQLLLDIGAAAHSLPQLGSLLVQLVQRVGEMRYEDENIWLTQKMMATLYDVSKQTISQHIKRIYADGELTPEATVKKYLTVQTEGTRQISRKQDHYNLQMIIAVGFKVNNQRAVQFRKWAGQIVKDHTIQGWTMDVDRLKKGHMFTDEYFERQLQQIREIRLSERKFYQKVTDLYATAFDYDKNAKTTRLFFQTVQNKMHFAVHRHTAAELIYERADATKAHMGL